MKGIRLVAAGFFALVLGVASLAFAEVHFKLVNEDISPGGTTGESTQYRASTLLAETIGSAGSSPNFGVSVVIVETEVVFLSPVPPEEEIQHRFFLGDNYPNPFNPLTTIVFDFPPQTTANLRVYDVAGRLVRVLLKGEVLDPGRNQIIWNGRDNAGRQCASGTYFYRFEAGDNTQTKRMVLIK